MTRITNIGGSLSPETSLTISITPYTSWRTGEEVALIYTTPSAGSFIHVYQ